MHSCEKDIISARKEKDYFLPPVRSVQTISSDMKSQTRHSVRCSQRIKSYDYAAWDKYSVENALEEIDKRQTVKQGTSKENALAQIPEIQLVGESIILCQASFVMKIKQKAFFIDYVLDWNLYCPLPSKAETDSQISALVHHQIPNIS